MSLARVADTTPGPAPTTAAELPRPTDYQPGSLHVLAALFVVVAADAVAWGVEPGLGTWGFLDEGAHVAGGLLVLAAVVVSVDLPVLLAVLAGSLLIDLDHVPWLLGSDVLQGADPRPYPHAILAVVVVVLVAVCLRGRARRLTLVAAAALSFHLFRDLAEWGGPGVSLFWPLSRESFTVPYWSYAALIVGAATVALYRRRGAVVGRGVGDERALRSG